MNDADLDATLARGLDARRAGDAAAARAEYTSALVACRQTDDEPRLVRALAGLAQVERDEDETAACVALYREALGLCRGLGDPRPLAYVLRHLGDVLREADDLEPAEPALREAAELIRADPETTGVGLANVLRPLALLLGATGRPDEARPLWHEVRELYGAAGLPEGVEEADEHLAALG